MVPPLATARSVVPVTRGPLMALAALTFVTSLQARAIDNTAADDWVVTSVTTPEHVFPGPYWTATQDDVGYLWLLVGSSVVRFDGMRFVELADVHPQSTVRPGTVWSLTATRDGSLWLGHDEGLVTRIHDGILTTYDRESGPSVGRVESIVESRNGALWARGSRGLAMFLDDRWQRPNQSQDSFVEQRVTSVFEDSQENLWVGTATGVFVRHAARSEFQVFSTTLRSVLGFGEDAGGAIWVTDPHEGVRQLAVPDASFSATPRLGTANGVKLLTDRNGTLWVATRGQGLWRLADTASTSVPSLRRFMQEDGLPSDDVRSLFEDREGIIWVGTASGLVMLEQRGRMQNIDVFSANQVMATRDGSVWVGTTDGLLRYSGTTSRLYSQADGLPGNIITALSRDPGGLLLVATDHGLARFVQGRFFPTIPLVPQVRIDAMTTDNRGALWLCVFRQGLFRVDSDRFEAVQEVGSRTCSTIHTDRGGQVWMGFTDGTAASYDGERFHLYSELDGLGGGVITSIGEDESGTVWFGTNTGLSRFSGEQFVSFSQDSGLPSHAVFSILGGSQGYLWCGVISGVIRINPSELDKAAADRSYRVRYRWYDTTDGLVGSPVYLGASPNAARGTDGRLWFLTTEGISIISPGRMPEDRPPVPVIETVIAHGQRGGDVAASNRLPARFDDLHITYTALNFSSPQKTRFRYFLEGFDSDWMDAGPRREAIYTNLPAGSYQFRVTASNRGSDWNEAAAVLDFVIEPRFYQALWFQIACLATIILAVYLVWHLRLRKVRVQLAIVHGERTRLAREIHDTLLQSLVGVALHFDVIAQKLDSSPRIAKQHLLHVRDEVEQYIREARQSIWNLRSPMLQAHDLAYAIRKACEVLTETKNIPFDFEVSGSPRRIDVRAEEHLLRICHEAVANAIRHADAAHVRVELRYSNGAVVLRVSDDGRGFDAESIVENRWGLIDMKERAREIGARFSVTTAPGQGTRVEVEVSVSALG